MSMGIAIRPYTEAWVPAVAAFNRRLSDGGVPREFHFPEHHQPAWLPKLDGRRVFQEVYVATEGDQVRGAYILKVHEFWVNGRVMPVTYYHLPVSEGIVNRRYSTLGVQMLRGAMKGHPRLFCLGMGGFDRPLPQMLKAMGWSMCAVPFHFHVERPARFLRHVAVLRRRPVPRLLADAAAISGLGWLGINAVQRARTAARVPRVTAEYVDAFGPWADDLWQDCQSQYTLIAARDSAALNALYPSDKAVLRLRVHRGTRTIGWAVLLDTQMNGNRYFGDLRVGSIADCLAAPEDALAVVQAATAVLRARGVDLLVSNQSHAAWTAALDRAGFLRGPSNFILAASQALSRAIEPFDVNRTTVHFNRGDGDGPVNL
jgi:hypothetical protein